MIEQDLIQDALTHAAESLVATQATGGLPSPADPDELWAAVKRYIGIEIPRRRACDCHVAPFDAFCDAYFAKHPLAVWWASRGFGGKSLTLSVLGMAESIFLKARVNILGGSGEQAGRILAYMNGEEMSRAFWGAPDAPRWLIIGGEERGLLKKETRLTTGAYIKALMASQRSVRGPHPQRLRLDEVDEMDIKLFDAAMGQPMARDGIEAQTVASSTWHNANGSMTEIMRRARDKGWPIFQWCYRENLKSNGGWLPDSEVAKKKSTIVVAMWDAEYEGQEPNPEGRAIDIEKCDALFTKRWGEWEGAIDEYIEVEAPEPGGRPEPECWNCRHPYHPEDVTTKKCLMCMQPRRVTPPGRYATGTDWAKKKDYTVIKTLRLDVEPVRLVAFERTGRRAWPFMVKKLEDRIKRFPGASAHDETGIGDVIHDYMTCTSEGVIMAGRARSDMLSAYIQAIEHGRLEYPWITYLRNEHRYASMDDVYGSGKKCHLPDTISSGSLAWKASGMGMLGEIMGGASDTDSEESET